MFPTRQEPTTRWFCNDLEEPYATPPNMPFSWQGRMRIAGGRTTVWGRQSYRLSDLDFKPDLPNLPKI